MELTTVPNNRRVNTTIPHHPPPPSATAKDGEMWMVGAANGHRGKSKAALGSSATVKLYLATVPPTKDLLLVRSSEERIPLWFHLRTRQS